MLFKLHPDKSPYILNEGLYLIKEFKGLSDRQFTVVALVADYQSPLRTLPDKERRTQAAKIVDWPFEGKRLDKNGRDFVDGKVKSIENAIAKYREIQYDEDRETLAGIDRQIHEIREASKEDKEKAATTLGKDGKAIIDYDLKYKLIEKAAKLSNQLPELYETRIRLCDLLKLKEDNQVQTFLPDVGVEEETDDGTRSTLDMVMEQERKKNE